MGRGVGEVRKQDDPVTNEDVLVRNYPPLSIIAVDFLIVPGSSALVERAFSTAGDAASGKRNCLTDKKNSKEKYFWEVYLYAGLVTIQVTPTLLRIRSSKQDLLLSEYHLVSVKSCGWDKEKCLVTTTEDKLLCFCFTKEFKVKKFAWYCCKMSREY